MATELDSDNFARALPENAKTFKPMSKLEIALAVLATIGSILTYVATGEFFRKPEEPERHTFG